MWLFTKNGHLAIGQHASDHGYLVVHAQVREDLENLVVMLDEAGVGRHEIQETVEGDYRFFIVARRTAVAEAVAKMVSNIDYGKFLHSVHFDFGRQPGYLLWLNRTGLQVGTVRE